MKRISIPVALLATTLFSYSATHPSKGGQSTETPPQATVRYGKEPVEGVDIFFREAGDPSNPTLVLLHGFPASSHMYREVLRGLGDQFHLIAPDYPGFGHSDFPAADEFEYSFDHLAEVVDAFLEQRDIDRYALMIQDYGAPVGFRIAVKHPERVAGIITMNGNAYEEGLSAEGWGPIFDYWETPTAELGDTIAGEVFTLEGMKWQYTHGTRNPESILPDTWTLDAHSISRPGQKEVQLGLFYDYRNNVKLYPQWQEYLREHQPPTLITWGEHDAFFPAAGARAFLKDVPEAELHLLNTGHFALEEEAPFIIEKARTFLGRLDW